VLLLMGMGRVWGLGMELVMASSLHGLEGGGRARDGVEHLHVRVDWLGLAGKGIGMGLVGSVFSWGVPSGPD
jgi:hypothetical protein